jgi:hypothetical protein
VANPNQIQILSPGSTVTRVVTAGTRGPRGPEGQPGLSAYELWLAEGNTGSLADFFASLSGGAYTHDQMTPGNVWNITHDLGFFPNVMTFDSAGTQIIGEVVHLDKNSMTITFSHSNAGKAYLS